MEQRESLTTTLLRTLISGAASILTMWAGYELYTRVISPKDEEHFEGEATLLKLGIDSKQLTATEVRVAAQLVAPQDVEVTFEDIGGLSGVKEGVREAIILPLTRPDLFRNFMAKGVLLYGPAGTGKTMVAKAVARECNAAFLSVNIASVLSKWVGESEKLVTAVFTLARRIQPCVIFIDEIDCLLGAAQNQVNSHDERLLSCFLTQWDGLSSGEDARICVLAASNSPGNINAAFHRRLARQFEVKLPSQSEREDIVRKTLHSLGQPTNIDVARIARETAGYSGSDLSELAKAACLLPVREVLALEQAGGPRGTPPRAVTASDFIEAKSVVKKATHHLEQQGPASYIFNRK